MNPLEKIIFKIADDLKKAKKMSKEMGKKKLEKKIDKALKEIRGIPLAWIKN